MRITTLDIETRRFPMKFRGFHTEEVASFLEMIREELEDLLRENAALKEQIRKADAELQRFWDMRDLLSRTVQDAHQASEEYKLLARREADDLREQAEEKVRDLIGEAEDRAGQFREEIASLKAIRRGFDGGVKTILSRFEAVIEGRAALGDILDSDEPAAEPASLRPDLLVGEAEIDVIEGHEGEEGGSNAEQQ